MVIYVDIDETICYYENDRDYYLAKPILTNINKINKLYDEGNEITYYTARGSVHKDKLEEYTNLTYLQLNEWGCKYHKLSVGEKPAYDLMICDKTKRIEEI
tara:strand:- start:47 stop:349 length:303 start_codon:yes stop_codon:yes gene_type:complete